MNDESVDIERLENLVYELLSDFYNACDTLAYYPKGDVRIFFKDNYAKEIYNTCMILSRKAHDETVFWNVGDLYIKMMLNNNYAPARKTFSLFKNPGDIASLKVNDIAMFICNDAFATRITEFDIGEE